MNLELAESFFRNIYDTHTPSSWGWCNGEHWVEGYEVDTPDYPCHIYKKAAEVLGLPIVGWVRPERKPRTPEQEAQHKLFMRIYEPLVRYSLTPPLFLDKLSQKSEGESMTFRIRN